MKFNRQIGDYADKMFSIEGNPLSEAEFKKHLAEVLPGPAEQKILEPIFKAGNWMSRPARQLKAQVSDSRECSCLMAVYRWHI